MQTEAAFCYLDFSHGSFLSRLGAFFLYLLPSRGLTEERGTNGRGVVYIAKK